MDQSQKLECLSNYIDEIHIQLDLMKVKQSVMNHMILKFIKEEAPQTWPKWYTDYVNRLEEFSQDCFDQLENALLEKNSPRLIPYRHSVFKDFLKMKRRPEYERGSNRPCESD